VKKEMTLGTFAGGGMSKAWHFHGERSISAIVDSKHFFPSIPSWRLHSSGLSVAWLTERCARSSYPEALGSVLCNYHAKNGFLMFFFVSHNLKDMHSNMQNISTDLRNLQSLGNQMIN
jgi:hypothetical protein